MKASMMFDARTKIKKSTNKLRYISESKNNTEASRLVRFTCHRLPTPTDQDHGLSWDNEIYLEREFVSGIGS